MVAATNSLELLRTQATTMRGVYVLPMYRDSIVTTQLPHEDYRSKGGKSEADPQLHGELIPLSHAMLSIVSGGVPENRGLRETVQLELSQEYGLSNLDPERLTQLNV